MRKYANTTNVYIITASLLNIQRKASILKKGGFILGKIQYIAPYKKKGSVNLELAQNVTILILNVSIFEEMHSMFWKDPEI